MTMMGLVNLIDRLASCLLLRTLRQDLWVRIIVTGMSWGLALREKGLGFFEKIQKRRIILSGPCQEVFTLVLFWCRIRSISSLFTHLLTMINLLHNMQHSFALSRQPTYKLSQIISLNQNFGF